MAEQNDKDVTLFYRQATPKGRKPVKNKSAKNKKAEVGKRKKKELSDMNVVMYLRKSSEEEEKQFFSIRDQEKKCLAYVEALEISEGIKIKIVKNLF